MYRSKQSDTEECSAVESVKPKSLDDLRHDYWMVGKIGSGGFGKVYLIKPKSKDGLTQGYVTLNGNEFAAKHQKWQIANTNYRGTRKETEMQMLARREASILLHLKTGSTVKASSSGANHVLAFVDYFEGFGQSVLVTEYVAGGELFARIASKNYSLTEIKCRNFFVQILKGLRYVHQKGIIHLDIKPQNVVFTSKNAASLLSPSTKSSNLDYPNERLKLIDFGLARSLFKNNVSNQNKRTDLKLHVNVEDMLTNQIPISMCGTLEFMSPEVMRCSFASSASDLWSTGVLLYMMLSGGHSPFWTPNSTEYQIQRRVLRGSFSLKASYFQNISHDALQCIHSLLTVDVGQRLRASRSILNFSNPWICDDPAVFEFTKRRTHHSEGKGEWQKYPDGNDDGRTVIKRLETQWMRKYLVRRRWQRWFNAIKAMNRMQNSLLQLSAAPTTSSIAIPISHDRRVSAPNITESSFKLKGKQSRR